MLESKGRLLDLSKPVVMGILNATPDSFYNQGRENTIPDLVRNAAKMLDEGAQILDIGGASSRPGARNPGPETELNRILPVITEVHNQFPEAWISVDTYHATVAREAIQAGASMVNDISAGTMDQDMIQTVAGLGVPYIAMHMQGTPATMQHNPQYEDVVFEVSDYLRKTIDHCSLTGIKNIIIDPGFGFGKTLEENFKLLEHLHVFRILGKPILAGISRKSMVCKPLGISPENALNGTTALHMVALQQGANILRVHDVKEAMEVIRLHEMLGSPGPSL